MFVQDESNLMPRVNKQDIRHVLSIAFFKSTDKILYNLNFYFSQFKYEYFSCKHLLLFLLIIIVV